MPDWKPEIRRRLDELSLPPLRAADIAEELAQHLDDRYRDLVGRGVATHEARRLVLEELDANNTLRDGLRQVEDPAEPAPQVLGQPRAGGWLNGLWNDVRHGMRALRKSPGLTIVGLLTLALGIGANVAIFSVVNAAILRPLPFADPDRLVSFWGSAPEMGLPVVNYPGAVYVYFRTRSHVVEDVTAYASSSLTLTGAGEPERLNSASVTADFFRLLGRGPRQGRAFLPTEEAPDRNYVTVLSHGLWQRRFGGDAKTIGRNLTLNGRAYTVVGVMPPGFDFPNQSELWIPLGTDPQDLGCWCYRTLGRLRPGSTPRDAARELARLSDDFWREREGKPRLDPDSGEVSKTIVTAVPLARTLVGDVRTPLFVLLGAVGILLLIACANIANLLLARATARGREIAVRCCLGASPWRIVRQLVVESLLLAASGATLGLGLAFWGVRVLSSLVLERLPHLDAIGIDPTVLLFALAVTVGTAVLFGLAPALRCARLDLQEAVKEGVRTTRGGASRRLNHAFVVAQFALSLVLLVGAGLLLRSFHNLLQVDLGFRPENVFVGRVSHPHETSQGLAEVREFHTRLAERVGGLPGVRAVGLSSSAPFSDGGSGQIFIIKGREPAPNQPNLVAEMRVVSAGYFAAIGTALVRGRAVDETDTTTSPPVAVVDETLARRFWPDGNAIGRQIRLGDAASTRPWLTIVGVAARIKNGGVAEEPVRYVYVPLSQNPAPSMDIVVRTAANAATLTDAIRREVQALDPTIPLYGAHTLENAVARSLGTPRLTNQLLLTFAVTAMLLAAIGIYGVMALAVSHRINEFGIRLALGATPRDVSALVLGQGMRLVGLGVVFGLAAATGLTRFLGSLLFGVGPLDLGVFGAVALALGAVALGACSIPARRATTTDPLAALRYE